MILPVLITLGIVGALYASRSTSPRAESARIKEFEVYVDPIRYGSNASGYDGKRVACNNDPVCDARAALIDLGYTNPVLVANDDPELLNFRRGVKLRLDFNVTGDLRADRERPRWMMFFPRDPAPATTTPARFA